jgi:hypothetical protein
MACPGRRRIASSNDTLPRPKEWRRSGRRRRHHILALSSAAVTELLADELGQFNSVGLVAVVVCLDSGLLVGI